MKVNPFVGHGEISYVPHIPDNSHHVLRIEQAFKARSRIHVKRTDDSRYMGNSQFPRYPQSTSPVSYVIPTVYSVEEDRDFDAVFFDFA